MRSDLPTGYQPICSNWRWRSSKIRTSPPALFVSGPHPQNPGNLRHQFRVEYIKLRALSRQRSICCQRNLPGTLAFQSILLLLFFQQSIKGLSSATKSCPTSSSFRNPSVNALASSMPLGIDMEYIFQISRAVS